MLSEKLYRTVFGTHPYGSPTIGWMADIEAIQLDDCRHFYETHYAPNNALVVVVGDVSTMDVLQQVQDRYGHMPAALRPVEFVTSEPPQLSEQRFEMALPLAAPRLVHAYRGVGASDPLHPALDIAVELLVGGESSRLERALIEDGELATDVGGWVSGWSQPGVLEISVTLRPDVTIAAVEEALEQALAKFLAAPPSEAELEKAKNGLEASFYRGLADVGSRARALGSGWATLAQDDGWRDLWVGHAALMAVTVEDVQAAAAKVLVPSNRTVAIALPNDEAVADDDDDDGDDA